MPVEPVSISIVFDGPVPKEMISFGTSTMFPLAGGPFVSDRNLPIPKAP